MAVVQDVEGLDDAPQFGQCPAQAGRIDDGSEHQPRLIFAVDDIDALSDHFERMGVEIIAGGPGQPWVMVRDADGNDVAFEK